MRSKKHIATILLLGSTLTSGLAGVIYQRFARGNTVSRLECPCTPGEPLPYSCEAVGLAHTTFLWNRNNRCYVVKQTLRADPNIPDSDKCKQAIRVLARHFGSPLIMGPHPQYLNKACDVSQRTHYPVTNSQSGDGSYTITLHGHLLLGNLSPTFNRQKARLCK